MGRKNLFWHGILLGLIVPVLSYFILISINDYFSQENELSEHIYHFRPRTLGILAICLNLIPFTYFNKKRNTNGLRGVFLATLILAAYWVYTFADQLLND